MSRAWDAVLCCNGREVLGPSILKLMLGAKIGMRPPEWPAVRHTVRWWAVPGSNRSTVIICICVGCASCSDKTKQNSYGEEVN